MISSPVGAAHAPSPKAGPSVALPSAGSGQAPRCAWSRSLRMTIKLLGVGRPQPTNVTVSEDGPQQCPSESNDLAVAAQPRPKPWVEVEIHGGAPAGRKKPRTIDASSRAAPTCLGIMADCICAGRTLFYTCRHPSRRDGMRVARQFTGGSVGTMESAVPAGTAENCQPSLQDLTSLASGPATKVAGYFRAVPPGRRRNQILNKTTMIGTCDCWFG